MMAYESNQSAGANAADLERGLQGSSDPLSPNFGGGDFIPPTQVGSGKGIEESSDSSSLVPQAKISALELESSSPGLRAGPPPAFESEKSSPTSELPTLPYQETQSTETTTPPSPTASLAPVEKEPNEKAIQGSIVPAPPKPAQAKSKPPNIEASLWIRFNLFFNTYRKFYTFVVTLNGIGIVLAGIGRFEYAVNHSGALVLGNLLCAVMMRNELFLRFLFLIANTFFAKWPPLCIRLGITSILQHIGGIHSGCATSGLAWLLYKVIELCRHASVNQKSVIAMGVVTSVAVSISTGEWTATGYHMISTQEFWFALGMTVFIVLPWTFTRRVPVHVEVSPKVAVLRFDRGMQQGLLGRISRSSMLEYHAFGGLYSDWWKILPSTFGLVSSSLREYRIRLLYTGGELGSVPVQESGAALSTCIQHEGWFLIWIGSDQEKTFGKTISAMIEKNIPPERRILWDSKKVGRPNTIKLIEEVYRSFDAEVVFITSNYIGNREMMVGCRKLGIPAFGQLTSL
ncbi:hypothetical protein RHS01_08629 [Rhizoctonia solani]|uniref:Uncharacterized protein n=1 Tax=Rhizoctonia solani TaxID=456999 RepID=A0A8H7I5K8_9AGAM|nr:hypothetical protein RHS01_08629 [Rhizoctonia solani]